MKTIQKLFITVLVGAGLVGSYIIAHTAANNGPKKTQTTRKKCNHGCNHGCKH